PRAPGAGRARGGELWGGTANPVDMIEPQALQLALGDQRPDQPMRGLEGAGVLDAQTGQRVDVEEAAIIDVARSQPPVAKPVMLAFEQMMQRQRLCAAIGARVIGGKTTRDDVIGAGDTFHFGLEARRFLTVRMTQASVP